MEEGVFLTSNPGLRDEINRLLEDRGPEQAHRQQRLLHRMRATPRSGSD